MKTTAGMSSPSERAYVHAKRGIMDGTHPVGQFFTEDETAEAVGVSWRPPATS
jgi:DNA-binding GntR family transcriptional regulator